MPHTPDALLGLCTTAVERARTLGADEAEIYGASASTATVKFQNNDLDQVHSGLETTLGIRLVVDGRLGFATTNRMDEVDALVGEALALAKACPPDEACGLGEGAVLPPSDVRDDALDALEPADLARLGRRLLDQLHRHDPRLTIDTLGLGRDTRTVAVASSTGVRASHTGSSASGDVFGMARDGEVVGSFAYDGDRVRQAHALEPALEQSFARFAERALGALSAQPGESFRGPILVPPDAVAGFLIRPLLQALCADEIRKGRSPFTERMGCRIATEAFTLTDEGAGLPEFALAPFDREGQPRRRRPLVEQGVLHGLLYDVYEARRSNTSPTGNALGGAGSPPVIGLAALSLAPGTTPLATLRDMPRGVLMSRFSGTVSPTSGDFSGVVKNGFLIEHGTARPIRETTVAGNLWRCLDAISGISAERQTIYGTQRLPTLRIEDVAISAG